MKTNRKRIEMTKNVEMDTREMKKATINQMNSLAQNLRCKLNVLDALDQDQTNAYCYDLRDQVTRISEALKELETAISRAKLVNAV